MTETNQDRELLIRLEGKVDNILEKLKDIPVLEKRVRELEIDCKELDVQKSRLENLEEDVDNLNRKSENWSIINSIGVAIAGLIAFFK